jgi:hypothetical protein
MELLEGIETHDIHFKMYMNNVQVTTHAWFRNLSSISENVTSELAGTHTLTLKQYRCFSVQSAAAEKLVW